MIKFSELEEIGPAQLLANTNAIIPVSTGNASLDTFKTTISNIGNYILSSAGDITANTLSISNITAGNITVSGNIIISTATIGNISNNLNVTGTSNLGGNVFVRALVAGNVTLTPANAWIYTANLNANTGIGFGDQGGGVIANAGIIEFSRWSGGYLQSIAAESTGNLTFYNSVNGISFNLPGTSDTKIHIRNTTGNLEVNSNLLINAGTVSLGNIAGARSRLNPGSNNSKFRVRPSMDLNGSGSVSSSDVLGFLQLMSSATSVNSYINVPFVLQHVDKPATGIMITNNSYLAESLDSTSGTQGQIYITAGGASGTIASYIRVGDDDAFAGNIYIKATTVNIGGNVTPININVSSNASIGNAFFTNSLLLGNSSTDAINSSDTTPDPTKSVTTIDTTGGPLSATLSSDTTSGMVKTFHMVTDGGDLTLTVTNAGWKGGASGTITFNDQGDGCILLFLSGRWHMIGNNGTVTA